MASACFVRLVLVRFAATLATHIVPDLQGAGGAPFLGGALNDGFLKASNNEKMKFALM